MRLQWPHVLLLIGGVAGAVCAGFWWDQGSHPATYASGPVPLPAPGQSVTIDGIAKIRGASGPQTLQLQVAVAGRVESNTSEGLLPAIPCRFSLSTLPPTSRVVAEVSELGNAWFNDEKGTTIFRWQGLDIAKNVDRVGLTNLGCRNGYGFRGGIVTINIVPWE